VADFVSDPFPLVRSLREARRVDVELHRVDQAVASYEGRLFLNNPDADRDTEPVQEQGYVGSFFVFGKVGCWGEDEGHCQPASERTFDRRRPPGRHMKVRVTVPAERLARLATRSGDEAVISVVVVRAGAADGEQSEVLRFERLSLIAYG
jgi:hypothetical protein